MITAKTIEATFRSKYLKKKGTVQISARSFTPTGISIVVNINGQQYDETIWDLPWEISRILLRNPGKTADIILLRECCVIADKEIWSLQKKGDIISVHCVTAQHFCEGMTFPKTTRKADIKKAIENEPPF